VPGAVIALLALLSRSVVSAGVDATSSSATVVTAALCASFATGGVVTITTVSGTPYCVHTFTGVGTSTFVVVKTSGLAVEYLLVGGGGGGGNAIGGGGGGGRVIESLAASLVAAAPHSVVVGAGGAGGNGHTPIAGTDGDSTVALGVTARGGGGGGSVGIVGRFGGSGGGGGTNGAGMAGMADGAFGGHGNAGGAGSGGINAQAVAGGGGGADSPGAPADAVSESGGGGGLGRSSILAGTSFRYGAGGGGGVNADARHLSAGNPGDGGLDGGGAGGPKGGNGFGGTAVANSGAGGGGASNANKGGAGGSGLVMFRYELRSFVERIGGNPAITIAAPGTGGASPVLSVNSNGGRLVWTSVGTNKLEVRQDVLGPVTPPGLKLFIQLGSGPPVEVPPGGGWVTLLASSTDTTGDQSITVSAALDPASGLPPVTLVTVVLEYGIGPA
jgi:hypothetical protein